MNVKFKKLSPDATPPERGSEYAAGYDLRAVTSTVDELGNYIYGTGIAVEIPKGYVGLLFPRSSIRKTSIFMRNHVGVIDCDYRGEIMATYHDVVHCGDTIYNVGDRCCQLLIVPVETVEYEEVEELSKTVRGSSGHGSTGN